MDPQILQDGVMAGGAVVALALLVVVVAVMTIRSLIVIVPPNRAAVLTGRNRMLAHPRDAARASSALERDSQRADE